MSEHSPRTICRFELPLGGNRTSWTYPLRTTISEYHRSEPRQLWQWAQPTGRGGGLSQPWTRLTARPRRRLSNSLILLDPSSTLFHHVDELSEEDPFVVASRAMHVDGSHPGKGSGHVRSRASAGVSNTLSARCARPALLCLRGKH